MFKSFCIVAVAVVALVMFGVVVAPPAEAATGPHFTGGFGVAPYTGNSQPAIATNGTMTLIVWKNNTGDIYGRLTNPATTSAGNPFRVSPVATNDAYPDVAWNGSSWLVVWMNFVSTTRAEVHGQRVSTDGARVGGVLDIAVANRYQGEPAVTAGPSGQFFVVWAEDRTGSTSSEDIYGRRISSSGGFLETTSKRLSFDDQSTVTADDQPDVGWNGEYYLVAWTAFQRSTPINYDAVHGVAYKPGSSSRPFLGHIGGAGASETVAYPARNPAIAVAGKAFVVVFDYTSPNTLGYDIHGARLSGTGSNWFVDDFPVSSAAADQSDATIAYNGQFMVAWADRRNTGPDLWGARLATDGTLQDPNGFLVTEFYPFNFNVALSAGSSKSKTFTITWESNPSGEQAGVIAYGIEPAAK